MKIYQESSGLFPEDEVKRKIAEGDEAAFTILFNHYYPQLHPFVKRFAPSEPDAQEILQETFVRIWLSRDKLSDVQSLRAWIFTVAARRCLHALRTDLNNRKKIMGFGEQAAGQQAPLPTDIATLSEINRLVGIVVGRMPPQRQRIYRLSREGGMKPAEIAEKLSLSVNTVKNVLVVALKEIRESLAASGHIIGLLAVLQFFSKK